VKPSFVNANVEVEDPLRNEEIRQVGPAAITAYRGRFPAPGGKVDTLEGPWQPNRLVIVEFPSVERARAWWSSPEYADAKALRQQTSDGSLIVIEGVAVDGR